MILIIKHRVKVKETAAPDFREILNTAKSDTDSTAATDFTLNSCKPVSGERQMKSCLLRINIKDIKFNNLSKEQTNEKYRNRKKC